MSEPYDDTYSWVADYQVEPGFHWEEISVTWRNGSKPSDCSDLNAKNRQVYTTPANVDLVRTDDCKDAATALDKRKKAVTSLQKRVSKASGKAKARLRKQLSTAKGKRAKAQAKFDAVC